MRSCKALRPGFEPDFTEPTEKKKGLDLAESLGDCPQQAGCFY